MRPQDIRVGQTLFYTQRQAITIYFVKKIGESFSGDAIIITEDEVFKNTFRFTGKDFGNLAFSREIYDEIYRKTIMEVFGGHHGY